ncbi:15916_t:CDS:2 [Funneliformis mosseae]|uniref:15916_t:CDS:1 n=1 Tax=Funneliformis mosseae TaxID=27381 RepID=A0A9N8VR12_FUNMO|nr:15916_t:CDS:2 [Funneliformis mosseae]
MHLDVKPEFGVSLNIFKTTDTGFINEEDIIYEEYLGSEPSNISSPDMEDTEIHLTKNMTVKMIIYSMTLVEYLPTSEEGVAIIYHVEEWDNIEAAFADIHILWADLVANDTTCSYLGNIAVDKKR